MKDKRRQERHRRDEGNLNKRRYAAVAAEGNLNNRFTLFMLFEKP
jgi:hypothetical protein